MTRYGKRPVQLYLEEKKYERLVKLSEETRVPMSTYLGDAIDRILENEEKILAATRKLRKDMA
jgi:predicted DNA-binding protein